MKLAVIVTDFGAAVNVGGGTETKVKVFDLPEDVSAYITSKQGQWSTVTLGLVNEEGDRND